jgi:hypothetical protein
MLNISGWLLWRDVGMAGFLVWHDSLCGIMVVSKMVGMAGRFGQDDWYGRIFGVGRWLIFQDG